LIFLLIFWVGEAKNIENTQNEKNVRKRKVGSLRHSVGAAGPDAASSAIHSRRRVQMLAGPGVEDVGVVDVVGHGVVAPGRELVLLAHLQVLVGKPGNGN
jgi:hypothetical protein